MVRGESAWTSCCCQEPGSRRRCRRWARPSGWSSATTLPRSRAAGSTTPCRRDHLKRFARIAYAAFHGGSFLQPRGALVARLGEPDARSRSILGWGARSERACARAPGDVGRRSRGPVVIGGDLNAHPDDTIAGRDREEISGCLGERARRPGTWKQGKFPLPMSPSRGSTTSSRVRRSRRSAPGPSAGTVSDHLMVIADLQVGGYRRGRGARPGFRKNWIATNNPKTLTVTTSSINRPRKNRSRNPLIASIAHILASRCARTHGGLPGRARPGL